MKKIALLAGLICCLSISAQSQESQAAALPPPTTSLDYQFKQITTDLYNLGLSSYEYKNYSDIQGSPYLNQELKEGKIVTSEGKALIGKLRFNIFTDEIEFEYKNNLLSIAKPDNFKEFYIDNQKLIYTSYKEREKTKKCFMLVTEEGDYTLMIKKIVEYLSKERQQPYSTPKPDRFETRKDIFYLSSKNQPAHRIVSLKKMIKSFPELKTIINSYPDKKIDFDDQENLKKLVKFINSQAVGK